MTGYNLCVVFFFFYMWNICIISDLKKTVIFLLKSKDISDAHQCINLRLPFFKLKSRFSLTSFHTVADSCFWYSEYVDVSVNKRCRKNVWGCSCWPGSEKARRQINRTVGALGGIKTAPWWLYKTPIALWTNLKGVGGQTSITAWSYSIKMRNGRQLGGSNELGNGRQGWPIRTSLLSRLFFPLPLPLPRIISAQQWDTMLNYSHLCLLGSGGKLLGDVGSGYIWCLRKLLMKWPITQTSWNMNALCLCSGWKPYNS